VAAPIDLLRSVRIFSGLGDRELRRIADSFKESSFPSGTPIAEEGKVGIGFFVIADGEAAVTIHGKQVALLKPGDSFGEVALIDDGPRTATVTATSDLRCYGLTSWEFRPLVEENARVAWPLLQTLAGRLREAEHRSSAEGAAQL
jgi:CRP/FNR family transcriptional regulator